MPKTKEEKGQIEEPEPFTKTREDRREIKQSASVPSPKDLNEDSFTREMRNFGREMERMREEWKMKVERKHINWEWKNNWGSRLNGEYKGDLLNNRPHGVGKWRCEGYDKAVEGEWKDGVLDGRAVYYWEGGRIEYEAKVGQYHGKFIRYYKDGSRVEREYRDGEQDGRERKYDGDGVITCETMW